MVIVSYSEFGVADLELYRAYIACNVFVRSSDDGGRRQVLRSLGYDGLPGGGSGVEFDAYVSSSGGVDVESFLRAAVRRDGSTEHRVAGAEPSGLEGQGLCATRGGEEATKGSVSTGFGVQGGFGQGGAWQSASRLCSEPGGVNPGGFPLSGGVATGPQRGPNFLRNQASREKKKAKKYYEQCFQRKVDADDELAAEVRRMRLERQKIQEQRKLDKLKSPVQMIEDAMKQVALAEKYAKLANDSKVAEWAAKLSSASAESIALSAGAKSTDVGSGKVSSVGTSYTKAVVDKFSVKKCPMTISEKTAVDVKVVRVDQVESLRRKINRTLTARDFMFADFPHPITMAQKIQIREAEDFCDTENIPIIEF